MSTPQSPDPTDALPTQPTESGESTASPSRRSNPVLTSLVVGLALLLVIGIGMWIYLELLPGETAEPPGKAESPGKTSPSAQQTPAPQSFAAGELPPTYARPLRAQWTASLPAQPQSIESRGDKALIFYADKASVYDFTDEQLGEEKSQIPQADSQRCHLWGDGVSCPQSHYSWSGEQRSWNEYFNRPGFEGNQMRLEFEREADSYFRLDDGLGSLLMRVRDGQIVSQGYSPRRYYPQLPNSGAFVQDAVEDRILGTQYQPGTTGETQTKSFQFFQLSSGGVLNLPEDAEQIDFQEVTAQTDADQAFLLDGGAMIVSPTINDQGNPGVSVSLFDENLSLITQEIPPDLVSFLPDTLHALPQVAQAKLALGQSKNFSCPQVAAGFGAQGYWFISAAAQAPTVFDPEDTKAPSAQKCPQATALAGKNKTPASPAKIKFISGSLTGGGQIFNTGRNFINLKNLEYLGTTAPGTQSEAPGNPQNTAEELRAVATEGVLYTLGAQTLTRWVPSP